jgi:hypothetical protein
VFEYFKACTDWFAPENDEVRNGASLAAQRTWRIMAYLNDVETVGPPSLKGSNGLSGVFEAW